MAEGKWWSGWHHARGARGGGAGGGGATGDGISMAAARHGIGVGSCERGGYGVAAALGQAQSVASEVAAVAAVAAPA